MFVNVFLVGFNLLPAFPMDGGRLLRAVLATRKEYTLATQIAALIGQGMALVFGFLGFVGNPFLLFIALFVWIGAAQEASMVRMKSALAGIPVRRAMITEFRTLSPRDVPDRAVELLATGAQKDFAVVDDGRVVGLLLHSDLPGVLARRGRSASVVDVMRRDFQTVDSHEMLEIALYHIYVRGLAYLGTLAHRSRRRVPADSSALRRASRARDSLDITVPMGIPMTSDSSR